jgi:hypothetical protein
MLAVVLLVTCIRYDICILEMCFIQVTGFNSHIHNYSVRILC